MKRSLVTFVAIYLLYDRQRRVERRQLAWKQGIELTLLAYTRDTNETLVEFAEGLVKNLNRALARGAR